MRDLYSICVFTPVFNSGKLIRDTIFSILNQNNNFNFLINYCICDGGSKDNTLEIIEQNRQEFKRKNIKLTVISEKDSGMYDALSKGMDIMGDNYDYYCYINAGDYFSPYAFGSVIECMEKNKIDWLTGLATIYNEEGKIISSYLPKSYNRALILQGFYGNKFPHIQQESTFWSRDAHNKIDLDILRKFKYAGDYYIWHTFAKFYDLHILRCWLGGFRIHDLQLSVENYKEYFFEFNTIRDRKKISSYWILFQLYIMRVKMMKKYFSNKFSVVYELD